MNSGALTWTNAELEEAFGEYLDGERVVDHELVENEGVETLEIYTSATTVRIDPMTLSYLGWRAR